MFKFRALAAAIIGFALFYAAPSSADEDFWGDSADNARTVAEVCSGYCQSCGNGCGQQYYLNYGAFDYNNPNAVTSSQGVLYNRSVEVYP